FATGAMVILVGKATRLAQFLDKDRKEYEALVRFGFETDTGDLTGTAKDQLPITNYQLPIEDVEKVLPDFRGEIMQTPPMYSAKKIKGVKLYELARKGIEIERKAVKVNIYELEVQSAKCKVNSSDVLIRVSCSAGTYIRTLAEDIGRKIGVGAHLAALRRTRAGKFDLSQAVTLEKLEEIAEENKLAEIFVSMNEAVSHLPETKLSADDILKVKNGVKLQCENKNYADNQAIRLTDANENLAAIGFYDAAGNFIQPKTVLL
ncbi:MAG: tRNA pseudouridine(55) synthase TruB, partial [Pyrinomonadaceae bacterium]